MTPLIRRVILHWRAWRARKIVGPQIASLHAAIERARKAHRPRAHLLRKLREARHQQLRMEMGVK